MQVLINQIPAPIYYVSPTQISVIVPYITTPGSIAQIQVVNNGANSNIVTQFTGLTSVGAFTNNPVGGIGYAAALRPDGSVISDSNPALVGETEALYLAGMGSVSPSVTDGAAAPSSPLSNTTNTPAIYLYDSAGNYATPTITFSGLAPGFAGLYQINFTIPSGLVASDAEIEIEGPDSDTLEALFPLSTSTSAARPAALAKSPESAVSFDPPSAAGRLSSGSAAERRHPWIGGPINASAAGFPARSTSAFRKSPSGVCPETSRTIPAQAPAAGS